MWIYSSHGGHILLTGEDQFMVDHVLRDISQTVEGTGWVELHADAGSEVKELADTLDARGLVVETRADALADGVPVCTTADEGHFLFGHDVEKLVSDFLGATEGFGVQEVLGAPGIRVAVGFPLSVDMEKGQVVGFWNKEFLAG